eukprot:TRINITY_DN1487_c1_g1_i2.p1 TRINITY_DN1487_c1_g1~~TRINITY_DN1487_c1_g1_i2.p1  ORF type:complete len:308 (+),score=53.10 TRINITY_DN1487_c1_g1_i2:57-980(+)
MACTYNVVVRNTFINVLEHDEHEEDVVRRNARPRTWSDPLPHFDSVDSECDAREDCPKDVALDSATETVETSDGYEPSEGASFSQEEWSSIDTPVLSPREAAFESKSSVCLDLVGGLLQPGVSKDTKGLDKQDLPVEWQGKTSVMVRNISYKCSRNMFVEELNNAGFKGLFDYAYVPINAGRGTSKGYAFANFVDDRTAYRFKEQFDGRKMNIPGGLKLLEVIPANLQGYSQNASHYIVKQSELSFTVKTPSATMTKHSTKCNEGKQNNIATHSDKSPEEHSASSCPQCKRHVLSKARFCQWCGVGL